METKKCTCNRLVIYLPCANALSHRILMKILCCCGKSLKEPSELILHALKLPWFTKLFHNDCRYDCSVEKIQAEENRKDLFLFVGYKTKNNQDIVSVRWNMKSWMQCYNCSSQSASQLMVQFLKTKLLINIVFFKTSQMH